MLLTNLVSNCPYKAPLHKPGSANLFALILASPGLWQYPKGMTNTDTRHPMFLTLCAIAKRRGFIVKPWDHCTILAHMATFEHRIDGGTIYTIDLCQRRNGELFAMRYMLRPNHPGASSQLPTTIIRPGDGSVSTILAQLRVPVAEQDEADRIAAVHESFEICEAEAYWPTDFRIAHPDER